MLNDTQIETYRNIADYLVPAAEGMPSASQAGVPDIWINKALEYRPDLVDLFTRALGACQDKEDVGAALEQLNASDTNAFDALGVLTSGAYFLVPDVKSLIGYPGQLPVPAQEDTEEYLDLLERVVDRGPVYRTVNSQSKD